MNVEAQLEKVSLVPVGGNGWMDLKALKDSQGHKIVMGLGLIDVCISCINKLWFSRD